MRRKQRSTEELREASSHLYYEISMLTSIANRKTYGIAESSITLATTMTTSLTTVMRSGIAGQDPIANALLEASVIHVRALMDFLYAEKPRCDDVIAEDYFANHEEWRRLRPLLSDSLAQAKRRAGKEIAHLTYARLDVTPETKPWPVIQIANEITEVLNIFLENVPEENLGSHWDGIKRA